MDSDLDLNEISEEIGRPEQDAVSIDQSRGAAIPVTCDVNAERITDESGDLRREMKRQGWVQLGLDEDSLLVCPDCVLKLQDAMSKVKKQGLVPAHIGPSLTCPLCLGTLKEPCSTLCGHVFCRACIESAIQREKKCPICRKKVTMKNIHKLYLSSC
ncbi:hypothetical protein HPP92_024961 [Vanilla planifolia]|uniref:RING-type domain-containing protein n=1 Tax=Vanilla planifolia TaxID=51239 RepID=A0A835PP34_VANPL|nr:hypothetical protein HPP92_024961 [Vanilla planifolia]